MYLQIEKYICILLFCFVKNEQTDAKPVSWGLRRRCVKGCLMYDLPSEIHFWLLNWHWKGYEAWPNVKNISTIPSYAGGLNRQHSVEYCRTLDLLASETPEVKKPCSSTRVKSSDPKQTRPVFLFLHHAVLHVGGIFELCLTRLKKKRA